MPSSKTVFHIYGAYYDNRTAAADKPAVRIVAFLTKVPRKKPYCQFWFEGKQQPTIVQAYLHLLWRPAKNGKSMMYPFLITCKIPPKMANRVPASVSLVDKVCDKATNNLRVIFNPLPVGEKKKDFLVCVKALFLTHKPHMAVRIVEWIELVKLLGGQKIVIYNFQSHENVSRVLDFYASKGNFEVVPMTLPGKFPNNPDLISDFLEQERLFQYVNDAVQEIDCLYRHLYQFNYLATLDIDEVTVPISEDNWHDLIYNVALPKAAEQQKSFAAYVTRNTYFMDDQIERQSWFPDVPNYMHMLQNVNRNNFHNPAGRYEGGVMNSKSIFDIDKMLALFSHYPRSCLTEECEYLTFDPSESQLQHYCIGRKKDGCKTTNDDHELVQDFALWKYKDQLIENTNEVLKECNFFK
ncbi:uncharacterized protein LOC132204532 [Neocloeon triangulifer]|uniref:uncharacterized protein LOC132204532 n=1 Tax=Neocloeon triangulifer TaxID=2078957 RepID=UPI00286F23C0|nr:uncharacterized protein LOC132204532 [Neocloeon triangulifer]